MLKPNKSCYTTAMLSFMTCFSAVAAQPPNVIIIFADDMGYGDLACYGHPTIKTPNIDRMATEGMRMTQFYSASSVSTPSRAALLTGRYPVRTGMWGDKFSVLYPDTPTGLPNDEITMAQIVQKEGYRTACIGKWHLGAADPYMPGNFGFDYYYGVPFANNFHPLPLMEGSVVLEDSTDQRLLTGRYTDKAIEFITSNTKAKRPFLLYYASTFPHVPLFASGNFEGKSLRGPYGDTVEELDYSVGRIIETLKNLHIDEQTLVIFTSDNGPWLNMNLRSGSSGLLYGGKGSSWEGGFRVPAIFRYPGVIPASSICYNICTTMDIFSTVVAVSGGKIPDDRPIDGVDVMPMLKNPDNVIRTELAYWRGSELAAIRRGAWKVQFHNYDYWYKQHNVDNNNQPILFNVERDPSENIDLSAQHPKLIEEFIALKNEYLSRVNIRASVNDTRQPK
jgi:arylsulfatase